MLASQPYSSHSKGTGTLEEPVLLGKRLSFPFHGHWNRSHYARVPVCKTNKPTKTNITGISRSKEHKGRALEAEAIRMEANKPLSMTLVIHAQNLNRPRADQRKQG